MAGESQREALSQRSAEGPIDASEPTGKRVPGEGRFPSIWGQAWWRSLQDGTRLNLGELLEQAKEYRGEGDSVGDIVNPQVNRGGVSSLPAEKG